MAGLFAQWQPEYAARGVATFPVRNKVPAVKNYLRIGTNASGQFALKFANDDSFGIACKRSNIVVLDCDTPDERIFADALDRHGKSPFIVRSGSGNWQAWYRHNGETRRVRPDPALPIDILGDGFVVAPPSMGSKGQYQIVEGSLDDLDRLPKMNVVKNDHLKETEHLSSAASSSPVDDIDIPSRAAGMKEGDGRNNSLFHRALRSARQANTKEELIQMVSQANQQFSEPLPVDEVLSVAGSAWRYKQEGRLMVTGGEATAVTFRSDLDHLWDKPLALALLLRLRMEHSWRNGEPFILAKATAKSMGVAPMTYLAARDTLVDRNFLKIVYPGGRGKNDPPKAVLL